MNIPVTPFMWVMACLPIIVLLILMLKFNWGAKEAAGVGLVITAVTGVVFYKADLMLLAVESVKGVWSSLTILLIVWTAILMYQVGDEAKAFLVIRNGMRKLLPNELLLVIAMGWILESFLQGITGFGVPVAVGAPLLIGIGVTPLWAVIIPLFGQAWGNTFGTLAAAWDSLAMSAGLTVGSEDYFRTAFWTALFLLLWNIVTGVAICWFYGKGKALKKGLPAVLIMVAIQGVGELCLSQVNTTLSCFLPSCISLVVVLFLGRMKMYRDEWSVEDSPIMDRSSKKAEDEEEMSDMTLVQAFVPYFLLSALTLVVLLVKPINTFLGQFSFGPAFPETSTGYGYVNAASECFSPIAIFTQASMFLFISSIVGLVYYKKNGWITEEGVKRAFKKSFTMTKPSAIAVIGLIVMSKLMSGTGQTVVLANGIAAVLGKVYVVVAPFVGFLGTFMTGSNMSSNILFGDFQMTTSNLIGVDFAPVLGAQSTGGAIGSAVSPSKIILGTTTANILGSEGKIMKKIIGITVPSTIAVGLIVFLMAI
ncbi:MAG: L-lactate permease [Lachnospiraceae bacterium]|nr:L-lactate permease [Lachnospiraceae bacterium]